MSKKNVRSEPKEEYINYLEPILSKGDKLYGNATWDKPRNHVFGLIAVIAAITAVNFFVPLPNFEWIWIILGITLGILLFIPSHFAVTKYVEMKQDEDSEYLSLKERNSPTQRWRIGGIAFVVMLVGLVALFSSLPKLAGGTVAVAMALGIYSFTQRTQQEFVAFIDGEIDPRDIPEDEEPEENAVNYGNIVSEMSDEEKNRMAAEYIELVNSLPKDKQALLLNNNLRGSLHVSNEDDNKGKKKNGLFGKKGS